MIIPFKYYLHDDKESWREECDEILNSTDLTHDEREAVHQKIGMPFYEVTLECELDTETGQVTVLKTSL